MNRRIHHTGDLIREDQDIWRSLVGRLSWALFLNSNHADQRDGELMYYAQRVPNESCLLRSDPAARQPWPTAPCFEPHGQMIDVRGYREAPFDPDATQAIWGIE